MPLSSMGAETAPVARVSRSAADGRLDTNSDSTWHPCGPPPLLAVFAATWENGVPEATSAAAAWAAVWLEKTAAVEHAVSNSALCRRK